MKKLFIVGLLVFLCSSGLLHNMKTVLDGEIGVMAGVSQYFGDLNPDFHFNTPKAAFGYIFQETIWKLYGSKDRGKFTQLGYSDVYNTQNEYDHRRNLSFNSNIWELSLQGDFNFFKFIPGEARYRYTPYVTFGMGMFSYDPYAYHQGQKVLSATIRH